MAITGIINYFDPENNFVANMNWLDKKTKEESTGILSGLVSFVVTRADSAFVATPIEFATIAENALLSVGRLFGAGAQLLVKGASYIAPAGSLDSIHDSLPSVSQFLATAVKTIKYAIGTFSTATVGILSPSSNVKIHNLLDLIKNASVNPQGSEAGDDDQNGSTTSQPQQQQGARGVDLQFFGIKDENNNNNNSSSGRGVASGAADASAAAKGPQPLPAPPAANSQQAPETPVKAAAPTTPPPKSSPGATVMTQQQYQQYLQTQQNQARLSPQPFQQPYQPYQNFQGFYPGAVGGLPGQVVAQQQAYQSINSANNALYSQPYGSTNSAPAARATTPTKQATAVPAAADNGSGDKK